MEDHSLRGYLSRRSVDELEYFLLFCLQEENLANYSYAVDEILDVLKDRVSLKIYLKWKHLAAEQIGERM